jgi:hypothetical protein
MANTSIPNPPRTHYRKLLSLSLQPPSTTAFLISHQLSYTLRIPYYPLLLPRSSPQIVDLSLILKDNAPSKTVDPDAEFSGDMWDSDEAKAAEEDDPFWK